MEIILNHRFLLPVVSQVLDPPQIEFTLFYREFFFRVKFFPDRKKLKSDLLLAYLNAKHVHYKKKNRTQPLFNLLCF